ncbi:hypothetical protein FNF31_00206 [Cafeteria roenbergensis]|uniref:Uncharacterized protein n=1 Tax=Cafeteria roenbergensis TaxID=33653 RepID=A0A5A8DUF6_CAFRO|nr:hypothetical protein FNF31_00206 [Cafeteria roenbergensis]
MTLADESVQAVLAVASVRDSESGASQDRGLADEAASLLGEALVVPGSRIIGVSGLEPGADGDDVVSDAECVALHRCLIPSAPGTAAAAAVGPADDTSAGEASDDAPAGRAAGPRRQRGPADARAATLSRHGLLSADDATAECLGAARVSALRRTAQTLAAALSSAGLDARGRIVAVGRTSRLLGNAVWRECSRLDDAGAALEGWTESRWPEEAALNGPARARLLLRRAAREAHVRVAAAVAGAASSPPESPPRGPSGPHGGPALPGARVDEGAGESVLDSATSSCGSAATDAVLEDAASGRMPRLRTALVLVDATLDAGVSLLPLCKRPVVDMVLAATARASVLGPDGAVSLGSPRRCSTPGRVARRLRLLWEAAADESALLHPGRSLGRGLRSLLASLWPDGPELVQLPAGDATSSGPGAAGGALWSAFWLASPAAAVAVACEAVRSAGSALSQRGEATSQEGGSDAAGDASARSTHAAGVSVASSDSLPDGLLARDEEDEALAAAAAALRARAPAFGPWTQLPALAEAAAALLEAFAKAARIARAVTAGTMDVPAQVRGAFRAVAAVLFALALEAEPVG